MADIPAVGQNLIGLGEDDPVFSDGVVTSVGAPIGLAVAATLATASAAGFSPRTQRAKVRDETMPIRSLIAGPSGQRDGDGSRVNPAGSVALVNCTLAGNCIPSRAPNCLASSAAPSQNKEIKRSGVGSRAAGSATFPDTLRRHDWPQRGAR